MATCNQTDIVNLSLDQGAYRTLYIQQTNEVTGIPIPFNGASLIWQLRENFTSAETLIDARDTTIDNSRIEVIDDALGQARLIIEGSDTLNLSTRGKYGHGLLQIPSGQTSGHYMFKGSLELNPSPVRV